ncbi:MAG: hypothetical protein IT377_13080 [Polyangiaceae bacterium]|nr:hypothetical protein [Polyangiaceae bacterium]
MLVRLFARARDSHFPLSDPVLAWHTWFALRRVFPRVWAASLTPSDIDILLETDRPDRAMRALSRQLAWVARRSRRPDQWHRVYRPYEVAIRSQMVRYMREVHTGPCDTSLVADPLSWPWSTYRGLMGAELDPWVDPADVAWEFRWPREGFEQRLHEYTTTDHRRTGTPLPMAESPTAVSEVPLGRVLRAAASATLWSPAVVQRKVAVALAHAQGWGRSATLGHALSIHPASVRRLARGTDPRWLPPAELCLGDARLCFDAEAARALRDSLDAARRGPEGREKAACRAHAPLPTCPASSSSAFDRSSTGDDTRSNGPWVIRSA